MITHLYFFNPALSCCSTSFSSILSACTFLFYLFYCFYVYIFSRRAFFLSSIHPKIFYIFIFSLARFFLNSCAADRQQQKSCELVCCYCAVHVAVSFNEPFISTFSSSSLIITPSPTIIICLVNSFSSNINHNSSLIIECKILTYEQMKFNHFRYFNGLQKNLI